MGAKFGVQFLADWFDADQTRTSSGTWARCFIASGWSADGRWSPTSRSSRTHDGTAVVRRTGLDGPRHGPGGPASRR